MNKIEALELELAARKMVGGTKLDWWEVIRNSETKYKFITMPLFTNPRYFYELALGVVEGKPVWKGDELYCGVHKFTAGVFLCPPPGQIFSWNPPKPKTMMIELLMEDIEHWSQYNMNWYEPSNRLYAACRKALESQND